MISLATSVIAGILVVVFLGYYALTLNQLPLWIVIIAVLAMAITDFAMSARDAKRRKTTRNDDQVGGPD